MCQCGVSNLLLSHALNLNFVDASAHTPIFLHASAQAQTLKNTTSTHANIKKHNYHYHSPFAFGDLLTPHLRSGIIAPLWNVASDVPALQDHLDYLDSVPTLPEFRQQAPLENSIQQETALATEVWVVEPTDDLDESGHRHKHAFYVLLNEWFQGRDYTCVLLTKQKHNEILQFCLALINGADAMTCNPRMHTGIKINPRMHTGMRKSPYAYGDRMKIPVCIRGSHDM
jgi:hypothetical protein